MNGVPVFMMHALGETRGAMRLFDDKGALIAKGTSREKAGAPTARWTMRWD